MTQPKEMVSREPSTFMSVITNSNSNVVHIVTLKSKTNFIGYDAIHVA